MVIFLTRSISARNACAALALRRGRGKERDVFFMLIESIAAPILTGKGLMGSFVLNR